MPKCHSSDFAAVRPIWTDSAELERQDLDSLMKTTFWIKRFCFVFLSVFSILLVVSLLKERSLERASAESAVWAGVTAVVFVTARIYQSRRGQHCALCRDTPEMARDGQCDVSSEGQLRK